MPIREDRHTPQRRIAAIAALAGIFLTTTLSAFAADGYQETEALTHARTIETAWRQLEQHILHESTAETNWSGTTPPAATGWKGDWTTRGLAARYCDDTLIVYAGVESLKGVGRDQRSVRLALHLAAQAENRQAPPLQWTAGGSAEGILGRASVTLPSCMSGAVPSDRVAFAGTVPDPFKIISRRATVEREDRVCPAGTHGPADGQAWVRENIQEINGRGDPIGPLQTGTWALLVDHCTPDYGAWEYYRISCTFTPGAPHVGTLTGEQVWRRWMTVTANGPDFAAPEFVSTSCWTDPNPTPPSAAVWHTATTETRTTTCGTGFTGTRQQGREVTRRHAQFPWDAQPIVQVTAITTWTTTSSNCRQSSAGNNGTGNNGGGNVGGGWDINGDGVADVDHLGDVAAGDRQNANYVEGHTPVGGDGGGPEGPSDPGSNCGGCGREGF